MLKLWVCYCGFYVTCTEFYFPLFLCLNSNRWQGNTYGAINYFLGVNLSDPHSESIYIWFIQAEKRNMQFGVWYWPMASNSQWKAFSRNGVIDLSVLSQYLYFIQWITKDLQNWQFDFKNEKMKGIPLFLGAMYN